MECRIAGTAGGMRGLVAQMATLSSGASKHAPARLAVRLVSVEKWLVLAVGAVQMVVEGFSCP